MTHIFICNNSIIKGLRKSLIINYTKNVLVYKLNVGKSHSILKTKKSQTCFIVLSNKIFPALRDIRRHLAIFLISRILHSIGSVLQLL